MLSIHKGLTYCFLGKDGNWLKSEEDFLPLVETEASLSISVQNSTFSQHEQLHTCALGVLTKQNIMSKSKMREHMSLILIRKQRVICYQKLIMIPASLFQW